MLQCDFCHYQTNRSYNFKVHQKKHINEKNNSILVDQGSEMKTVLAAELEHGLEEGEEEEGAIIPTGKDEEETGLTLED